MCLFGNLPHLMLPQMSDGKHQFVHLQRTDLAKKIRLVFHGVGRSGKPHFPVHRGCRGIMPCGSKVKLLACHLFETAELDEFVAHHIRIRCQPLPCLVHRVTDHLFPIVFMQVDHIKLQTILPCQPLTNLHILFRGAVPLCLFVGTYLDVKQMWVNPLLFQQMHRNSRIDSTRNQSSDRSRPSPCPPYREGAVSLDYGICYDIRWIHCHYLSWFSISSRTASMS